MNPSDTDEVIVFHKHEKQFYIMNNIAFFGGGNGSDKSFSIKIMEFKFIKLAQHIFTMNSIIIHI